MNGKEEGKVKKREKAYSIALASTAMTLLGLTHLENKINYISDCGLKSHFIQLAACCV